LKEHLAGYFTEIDHLSFPDHHKFSEMDISKIEAALFNLALPEKFIITTEKDAIRLRELTNIAEPFRSSAYYIPIEVKFLNEDKDEFDNLILEYVRKNKRDNRVSEIQRL
jgi:tetraacyldisaccharide 4'-kinase